MEVALLLPNARRRCSINDGECAISYVSLHAFYWARCGAARWFLYGMEKAMGGKVCED